MSENRKFADTFQLTQGESVTCLNPYQVDKTIEIVEQKNISSLLFENQSEEKNMIDVVKQVIGDSIGNLNNHIFGFELSAFSQIDYMTTTGTDVICPLKKEESSFCNKLSFVMFLNNDYEGGGLEVYSGAAEETTYKMNIGTVVVFPSWTPWQINQVTSGEMKLIVGSIAGPRFR